MYFTVALGLTANLCIASKTITILGRAYNKITHVLVYLVIILCTIAFQKRLNLGSYAFLN